MQDSDTAPGPSFSAHQSVPGSPAAAPGAASDRDAALYTRATALTVMAVVLIVCVGVVAIILLRSHRRRLLASSGHPPVRKRRTRSDAWFESARRLNPRASSVAALRDPSDDDTVDLDPEDLTDRDIGSRHDGVDDPRRDDDDDQSPPRPPREEPFQ